MTHDDFAARVADLHLRVRFEPCWGPIYKISYDLSEDYIKFIVRSTDDSHLQRATVYDRNIVS